MIRVFRKIRHQLLSENNYGIYLLYASGEILLVIVGILLALQIDAWSQERADRKSENYFLNQIHGELVSDSMTVHRQILLFENNLDIIESLVKEIHRPDNMNEFNSSLRSYLNDVWSPLFITVNNATFEEMKSNAKLGIIENNSLRNRIVSIYDQLDHTQSFIRANSEFLTPMDQKLSFAYSLAKFIEEQQASFGKYITEEDVYQLKEIHEALESNAANWHWSMIELIPVLESQLNEIRYVSKDIEDYLANGSLAVRSN